MGGIDEIDDSNVGLVGVFKQQHLATVLDGALRLIGDCGCVFSVLCQGSKHLPNADVAWQRRWFGNGSRNDLKIMRRAGRGCRGMSDRPILPGLLARFKFHLWLAI